MGGGIKMEIFKDLAPATVVLTFFGAVFSYFILRPLYAAISELRLTIRELREEVRINEERRHQLEIKVAEVDQSAKSAHHRIDTLQRKVIK